MLYAILKPLTMLLSRLFFGLRSRGREHVPAAGPVLFVANHASFLDPPLVGSASPRHLNFLAKAELFGIPLFGGLIRRLNAHPLRREGGDAAALRTALRVLKSGGALLVFPEGTRGENEVLGTPKPGAGMLAVLGGAPVIPVYVSGEIRTPEISELTSRLTLLARVRERATPIQRALAAAGGVVLEGRDTGTVVCPHADVKFYLDASIVARARRRQAELAARGVAVDVDVVREEIVRRDRQDTARALAPLAKAPDAIAVDTTDLDMDQVVEAMVRTIESQCCTRS